MLHSVINQNRLHVHQGLAKKLLVMPRIEQSRNYDKEWPNMRLVIQKSFLAFDMFLVGFFVDVIFK